MVHPCIGHAESVVASRVPYLPEQVGKGGSVAGTLACP